MAVEGAQGKGEEGNNLGALGQKVSSVGESLLKKLDGMLAQMQNLQRSSGVLRLWRTLYIQGEGQGFSVRGWNHVARICPSLGKANWGELNRATLAPGKGTQNGPGSKQ